MHGNYQSIHRNFTFFSVFVHFIQNCDELFEGGPIVGAALVVEDVSQHDMVIFTETIAHGDCIEIEAFLERYKTIAVLDIIQGVTESQQQNRVARARVAGQ